MFIKRAAKDIIISESYLVYKKEESGNDRTINGAALVYEVKGNVLSFERGRIL